MAPEKTATVRKRPGWQEASFAAASPTLSSVSGETRNRPDREPNGPLAAGAAPTCSQGWKGKHGLPHPGGLSRMPSLPCEHSAAAQSPAYSSSPITANATKTPPNLSVV